MDGIERNIEEEGRPGVLGPCCDDSLCFGGKEVRSVAFFLDGFLVAMPVVDSETSWCIVNNGLGVVGFIKEGAKADDEFSVRMEREAKIKELVAKRKQNN